MFRRTSCIVLLDALLLLGTSRACFATPEQAKPTSHSLPALAFTNTLDKFFGDTDNQDADTFVWSAGTTQYHLEGGYQVAQWCPKLHALLLTRGSNVYTWRPGASTPNLLVELSKYIKYFADSGPEFWPTVSLSPDDRTLAVYDNENPPEDLRMWLVDVHDRKSSQVLVGSRLEKLGVSEGGGQQAVTGITWSPDGDCLAVGCREPAWPQSTDGGGPTACVVWWRSGKCRYIGQGAPVAWLDRNKVVCATQIFRGEHKVAPEILNVRTGRAQIRRLEGEFVASANGFVVLAKRNADFIFMDSRLKVIARMRIDQFNKGQSRSNIPERHLVAIPSLPKS